MRPIGLILLLLTGVGPLLAWRKSTFRNFADQFLFPVLACATTAVAMLLIRIPFWASGLCFSLCAFVTGTILQEFWRGANVRRKNTGTDIVTAVIGLVGRNKRRYGGYIVHIGIVLIFLGFAGNGSKKDAQVLLAPGQQTTIGRYTIQSNGIKVSDDGQKQMTTAYLTVFAGGKEVDRLYPAKWAYRHHEQEPTTEVAIRRTVAEDLYATLGAADLSDQTATLEFFVNPLVDWIWFGFGILALGTGITLLPERAYSFALAKLPATGEAAAAGTIALVLVVMLTGTTLSAQKGMGENPGGVVTQTSFYARTELEKQLQHEIVCTCGACGHSSIAECRKDPCPVSHEMRGEVAALLDQGKTHDEVIQAVVAKYGTEEMLGAPLDKGFNRLVWFFPYLIGVGGAVAIGFAATKWSRHPAATTATATPADPDLDDRINDELRDLD